MNILHVRLSGGVSKGLIGGGPQHFNQFLNNLSLYNGVSITILTNDWDESIFSANIKRIGVRGLDKIKQDPISLFLKLNFSFINIWKNLKFISEDNNFKDISVILSESPFLVDILTTIYLNRKYKVPVIVYFFHLTPPPWIYPSRRGFGKVTVKWLNETISLVLVKLFGLHMSLGNKRILSTTHWKIAGEVLQNECYLNWADFKISYKYTNDKIFEGCFVGRIQESKGVDDLLYLWKKVKIVNPKAKMILVGNVDTKFGARIVSKVVKFGLSDNVILTGFIDEKKKVSILRSSKLFIFPSYEEGWSLSVMEAVRYGCVPVVYDLPAYDYLGKKAAKVKLGDRDQLVNVVLNLLQKDESSLANINYIILNEIKKYDMNRVTKYQLDFFRRIAEKR